VYTQTQGIKQFDIEFSWVPPTFPGTFERPGPPENKRHRFELANLTLQALRSGEKQRNALRCAQFGLIIRIRSRRFAFSCSRLKLSKVRFCMNRRGSRHVQDRSVSGVPAEGREVGDMGAGPDCLRCRIIGRVLPSQKRFPDLLVRLMVSI
jgi:hypothetical protein